jgi:hypothetical protein
MGKAKNTPDCGPALKVKQVDYRVMKIEVCRQRDRLLSFTPTAGREADRDKMVELMNSLLALATSECGQNMMPEY